MKLVYFKMNDLWKLFLWSFFVVCLFESSDGNTGCKDKRRDCHRYSNRCGVAWVKSACEMTCLLCQVKGPLFFVREPKSIVAVTRKNATFHCNASATGKEIIYFWKFNGSFIHKDNNNGFKLSNGSLQIKNVTGTKHSGTYECIAVTKHLGSIKSREATLLIAYLLRQKKVNSTKSVLLGKSYLLHAPVYKALPEPTFVWQYLEVSNGRMTWVNTSNNQDLFVTSQGHLLIPSLAKKYITEFRVIVYHPTFENHADNASISLTQIGVLDSENTASIIPAEVACPDPSMMSFPTVRNKTVIEGSTISFECLAVAKRCNKQITMRWYDGDGALAVISRKLDIYNARKSSYKCQAKVIHEAPRIAVDYILNVIEKPKFVKAVRPNIKLPADGILRPAVYSNVASFAWYKDGEIIKNRSALFEVFANGNLKIKNPSPAFNGIYQMFYENQAGTAVVSQSVNASNIQGGCGWKILESSGTITYSSMNSSLWINDKTCTWIIQVPSTNFIQFNITKFSFQGAECNQATLFLFGGSTATGASFGRYCSSTAKPYSPVYARGPFITLILQTELLVNGGEFSITFGPISEVPTTISTGPTSTASRTATTGTGVETTTSMITTTTVLVPEGKLKGGTNIGAIIGGIFGTLMLVAIILLIIYRKKVLQMFGRRGKSRLPENMPRFGAASRDHSSKRNNTYQDGAKSSYPDVVPNMNMQGKALGYQKGYIGPGDTLCDENPTYEAVGSVISGGGPEHKDSDGQEMYDIVGTMISGSRNGNEKVPVSIQNSSKYSKTSSTKSEPYYHQLEEGINQLYESADSFDSLTNRHGINGNSLQSGHSLQSGNSGRSEQDFARIPSGRSDAQYTPLDSSTGSWYVKENSIYEPLTLERIKGASWEKNRKDATPLGEYCDPYAGDSFPATIHHGGSMRESCALYESADTPARIEQGLEDVYSEPYEPIRAGNAPMKLDSDGIYSEPL